MTVRKALELINKYISKKEVSIEEEDLLIESFDFLIEIRKDPDLMRLAGDYHSYRGRAELAEIYYNMSRDYSI